MSRRDIDDEELAIYLVAIAVLAPVVVIALIEHIPFHGGPTLCLVAVVLGAIGIASCLLKRLVAPRLPRARMRVGVRRPAPRVAAKQDE